MQHCVAVRLYSYYAGVTSCRCIINSYGMFVLLTYIFAVSEDAHHWMDSTHYEICIPTNQTLNVDIRSISLISSEQFRLNNYTYNDLPEDVTFTLNGSCPDFYFSWPGMVKQTVVFQNYYDLYVADKIERVSLTVAKSVRPGDYEMQVIVTTAGNVIEKSDITVYVRDIQLCEASIGKCSFHACL